MIQAFRIGEGLDEEPTLLVKRCGMEAAWAAAAARSARSASGRRPAHDQRDFAHAAIGRGGGIVRRNKSSTRQSTIASTV